MPISGSSWSTYDETKHADPQRTFDDAQHGGGEPGFHMNDAPPQEHRPGQEPASGQNYDISVPDHDADALHTGVNATHHIAELLAMKGDDAYQKIHSGWTDKHSRESTDYQNWVCSENHKAFLRLLRIFDCEEHIIKAASHLCDLTMTWYAKDVDLLSWIVDHLYAKSKESINRLKDWRTAQRIGKLRHESKETKADVTKAALAVAAFAVKYEEGKSVSRPGDLEIGSCNDGDLPH